MSTTLQQPTYKEKIFISEFVKEQNGAKAAFKAYNVSTQDSAKSVGSEVLARPYIKEQIDKVLERRGLTQDWACKILHDQGKATRPVILGKELKSVPDNNARIEASKTTLRLHGHLTTASQTVQDNRTINFTIENPKLIESLKDTVAILGKLTEYMAQPHNEPGGSVEVTKPDKPGQSETKD